MFGHYFDIYFQFINFTKFEFIFLLMFSHDAHYSQLTKKHLPKIVTKKLDDGA